MRHLLHLSLSILPFIAWGQAPLLQHRQGPVATTPVDARSSHTLATIPPGQVLVLFFNHTLNAAEREMLTGTGLRFLAPFREHGWAVEWPGGPWRPEWSNAGVIAYHRPTEQQKLDPRIAELVDAPGRWKVPVLATAWPGLAEDMLRSLEAAGIAHASFHGKATRQVSVDRSLLRTLLRIPAVQWVEPIPEPGEPEDLRARTFHRAHALGPAVAGSPGSDGSGVVAVVNDDGYVGPHIDFKGRTEQGSVAGDLVGDHGDMVAGILAGAGNRDPRHEGMAPGAFLIIRQYQSSMPNTVQLHLNDDASIFSTSYSNGCNAGYTSTARQMDEEVFDHPSVAQVFSAGNAGGDDCGYGAGNGWGNITGGHKVGKNVLAVANLTDDGQLVPSSSRGPTADGRVKPDIASFGNGQISTAPDHTYMTGSGTSAAAPGVAGALALLTQAWQQQEGGTPPSTLLRAFLLNNADDLGERGPDYRFGWGRVNTTRAWNALAESRWTVGHVDQGQSLSIPIEVPAGTGEMRVMVCWNDPPGNVMAASALVNDLDLRGTAPDNSDHLPWALDTDPFPASLAAPAIKAFDRLNNVEQVHVSQPQPGTWTFTVNGWDVPLGVQEYFLTWSFIADGPEIAYPLPGDVLAASASHRMRWDAINITDPIAVSLSIDSGITWGPVINLAGTQRHWDIAFGDTIIAHAFVRVVQDGWLAQSGPFSTMRTATALQVVRNCPDSATVTWPAVNGATAYIMHRLGDRYMDSVAVSTTNTFTFTGLQPMHEDWFAVTAIGPQGIVGPRSQAIARPQQLVDCVAEVDLTVDQFLSPTGTVFACQPQHPEVTITVRNVGLQTVPGFDAGMRVNAGAPVTITVTDTLPPGASIAVTFPPQTLGLVPGDGNRILAWASAQGESFPVNDSLQLPIVSHTLADALPWYRDMEDQPICLEPSQCTRQCPVDQGLINALNGIEDDIDWRADTAGTNSNGTGPTTDHTLGTTSGRYLYMEATGTCTQAEAHLFTPCFTLAAAQALSFRYHMLGSGMGALHVDLMVDGAWVLDVMPPLVGDQGDTWHEAVVDLSAYVGRVVNVRFRGVVGPSHLSDLALDDIWIGTYTGLPEMASDQPRITPGALPGTWTLHPPADASGPAHVHVMDAVGRVIQVVRGVGRAPIAIDLSAEPAGVYLMRWSDARRTGTVRSVRP